MPEANSKNSSQKEQQQTAQTVPYPSPYPQQFEDDTINFYELWIIIWNSKWLVIAMTIVAALGSIVYGLQQQHVYKAIALVLPPKDKDIKSLKVLGELTTVEGQLKIKFGTEINNQDVFNKFKQNLSSRTILKKFVQEYGLMELLAANRTYETRDEDIFKGFAELIKLEEENGGNSISIEMDNGEIAAQWVNDLIEFCNKETVAMLVDDVRNKIENQIRDIEYTIASKRQMAKIRRKDQIIRYTEYARIAKELGMHSRVDATNIVQNTQLMVDIATSSTSPLYYLGYEALNTEIEILRDRESDDPFIGGLRDLQEQLTLLRTIKIDKEETSSVNIDQAAYPVKSAIKPNRGSIVYLVTVVGLFSGIFLVFLIEFLKNQRKEHLG